LAARKVIAQMCPVVHESQKWEYADGQRGPVSAIEIALNGE